MVSSDEEELDKKWEQKFEEEVDGALNMIYAPYPFENIQPRIRDWFADGRQLIFVYIVMLGVMGCVFFIELLTNIDLGLVPNGP